MPGAPNHIAKYRLLERIGAGGMGEVYLAELTGDGGYVRKVALKLILPEQARKPRYQELFLREARCLAALRHRGIVQVFEQGSEDGRLYLAMELLEGRTLREVASDAGPLPWQVALFIVSEVAQALAVAHALRSEEAPGGLVHGDLSPSNVMLCFDGGVKVLDFGLTRAAGSEQSVSGVQGKLPYLPPESLSGAASDPRADIYACGVILHELLTGRLLFRGTNELETMHRVMHDPITPPSSFMHELPPPIDEIIARAMARDRQRRYANATQLAEALDEVLAGRVGPSQLLKWLAATTSSSGEARAPLVGATTDLSVSARVPRTDSDATERDSGAGPGRRPRALAALVIVGVLALASVAGAYWWPRSAPPPLASPSTTVVGARAADLPSPNTVTPTSSLAPAPARSTPVRESHSRRPRGNAARVPEKHPEGISPGLLANPFGKR